MARNVQRLRSCLPENRSGEPETARTDEPVSQPAKRMSTRGFRELDGSERGQLHFNDCCCDEGIPSPYFFLK